MANQHQTGRHSAARPADREDARRQKPSERPDEGSWSPPRRSDDDRRRAGPRDPQPYRAPVQGDDSHDRFERGDRRGSVEYRGLGQSGYGAGRSADPATGMQNWPDELPSPGSFEDRNHELGVDDRFTGRGGSPSRQDPNARKLGDVSVHGGYRGRDFEPERRALMHRHGREGLAAHRAAPGTGPRGWDDAPDERLSYPAGAYAGSAESGAGPDQHAHRGTGPHRGKGPIGYQRSDDQLRDRVCESLSDDDQLDASQIEVAVEGGEVTLSGTVDDRRAKRDAEDCASSVPGVRDVQNRLRVRDRLASLPSNPSGPAAVSREDDAAVRDRHRR